MRIHLPSGAPAELARPADGEADAGLVILPDIGGVRRLFDDMAQQLADELGRVVCVPEPFPGRESMDLDERLASVSALLDDDVLGDALAAAEATGHERVDVIGFCLGGMYTLKAAGTGRFDRAVAFYGMIRVPDDWKGDGQSEPLDAVRAEEACPVLAIVGTDDPYTPADDVDALEDAGVEVVRYAGAEHGFVHAPDRPAHRPDYAADAWRRAKSFIQAEGKPNPSA